MNELDWRAYTIYMQRRVSYFWHSPVGQKFGGEQCDKTNGREWMQWRAKIQKPMIVCGVHTKRMKTIVNPIWHAFVKLREWEKKNTHSDPMRKYRTKKKRSNTNRNKKKKTKRRNTGIEANYWGEWGKKKKWKRKKTFSDKRLNHWNFGIIQQKKTRKSAVLFMSWKSEKNQQYENHRFSHTNPCYFLVFVAAIFSVVVNNDFLSFFLLLSVLGFFHHKY